MIIKIKTKEIELEYTDEYSMIEESSKKRIIEILDKLFEKSQILGQENSTNVKKLY